MNPDASNVECTPAVAVQRVVSWRPIATAPTKERKPIWLKVPGREPAAAYSDTFWRSGFSVECKPAHWKPRTEPANAELSDVRGARSLQ